MTHTLIAISKNHNTETTSSVYSVLNNTKCLSFHSALTFPHSGDGVPGDFLRTPPAISEEQMDVEEVVITHAQCSIWLHVILFYVISWGQFCAARDVNLRSCQVSNYFIINTVWQIIHITIIKHS